MTDGESRVPAFEVLALVGDEDAPVAGRQIECLRAAEGVSVIVDMRRCGLRDPQAVVAELVALARGKDLPVTFLGAPKDVGEAQPGLQEALDGAVGPLRFRLGLPCHTSYLPELRDLVSTPLAARFGGATAFHMGVIVEELCLNAIEHGPGGEDSRFEIEACLEEDRILRLRVSNGPPRSDDRLPAMNEHLRRFDASGEYLEERGRGLFLIAQLSDGLKILAEKGRISVCVWKELEEEVS
jgi:anti-sigma regulatory factor (Ser/Thr protein kinase)